MEPHNVESDLQSLRRLYRLLHSNATNESIPLPFLLDDNTQLLLKRLLDSATKELLARQSKILAQVQLGLPERVSSTPSKNSVSRGIIKLPSNNSTNNKAGLRDEIVDSIERIETQLSAFRFCSSRVADSNDRRTRSYNNNKSPSVTTSNPIEEDYLSSTMPALYEVPKLSEKALTVPMSSLRNNYSSPISQRSVNNGVEAIIRNRNDPTLVLKSQGRCSPNDERRLLPPLPVKSVVFKKPSESKRTSMMKPTLLDQESESWDEEESGNTRSTSNSEDEESGEIESSVSGSGSSWETQGESVTESSGSSSSPIQSNEDDNDDSQVSDSPQYKKRDDFAKQSKKAIGRFTRFKNKIGQVFHTTIITTTTITTTTTRHPLGRICKVNFNTKLKRK